MVSQLNQMEILANFATHEDFKKNYLSAIVAYIVGGGFHSLHEVLGPAQYCLNLVPGYPIKPPQQGIVASSPRYDIFFEQQEKIDDQFANRRALAWQNYLNYFNQYYYPEEMAAKCLSSEQERPLEQKTEQVVSPKVKETCSKHGIFAITSNKNSQKEDIINNICSQVPSIK